MTTKTEAEKALDERERLLNEREKVVAERENALPKDAASEPEDLTPYPTQAQNDARARGEVVVDGATYNTRDARAK